MSDADANAVLLTINGGSSSIKFSIFPAAGDLVPIAKAQIDQLGSDHSSLLTTVPHSIPAVMLGALDHRKAAARMLTWVDHQIGSRRLVGIGHRLVFGGAQLRDHQLITPALIEQLGHEVQMDLTHLPAEIALIEALAKQFHDVPQVACFDTAFHKTMPRVAQRLPIPREFHESGVQRLGFHGLSYEYLSDALARLDPKSLKGRVIFAHLGSGASMAAVTAGAPIDTTMGFTPLAGLVMGTRSGDLDPGAVAYLARNLSPTQLDDLLNRRCGLRAISETSGDMRDLTAAAAAGDERAADAIELFCYRARQWIGSLAASMGGLDVIVFAGGIGERSSQVRANICQPLGFLGIELDDERNNANTDVISAIRSRVKVRVIPTDEEFIIARNTRRLVTNQ